MPLFLDSLRLVFFCIVMLLLVGWEGKEKNDEYNFGVHVQGIYMQESWKNGECIDVLFYFIQDS